MSKSSKNYQNNPAFQTLLQHISSNGKSLLIADENLGNAPLASLSDNITLLTNRFDLYQQARQLELNCLFNDFDFSSFEDGSFSRILYRVSKEKPVVHHIINQAKKLLKISGELILVGEKNEGIKTYIKKAEGYFSCSASKTKNRNIYCAVLTKTNQESSEPLDDKNYSLLRPEINDKSLHFYSKPGIFGWNKIDQGSQFLAEKLPEFLSQFSQPPKTVLDLGCGYGYLSVKAHQLIPEAHITTTDNNAAAITACEKNFQERSINGEVIADNCAENIDKTFDAVICNPPFHQGFETDDSLTDKFISATHHRLNKNGKAIFVVNSFLPLEIKARNLFKDVEILEKNSRFKLIILGEKSSITHQTN